MNSESFKALQAPLKQKYRDEPNAARITLHAKSRLSDGISCKVETGKGLLDAGLHPATGGDGSQACSGDLMLEALTACAGVTLSAVSTALGVELRDALVHAEGDLDFRGTLGVSKEAPVGFSEIRLRFELDSDSPKELLEKVISLTERYCVVLQTLRSPPKIVVTSQPSAGKI